MNELCEDDKQSLRALIESCQEEHKECTDLGKYRIRFSRDRNSRVCADIVYGRFYLAGWVFYGIDADEFDCDWNKKYTLEELEL